MGFYDDVLLPRLCDLGMRSRRLRPYRERAVASAEGRILEVGIGSGLNLPFYSPAAREIVGLEPSSRMVAMARKNTGKARSPVTLVEGSAEAIPLESESVDTVVTTWTLCSIPRAGVALGEMRRVLRRGGRLLFVEHGLAPDERVRKWQQRLTPAWRRFNGGCHLDRPIQRLIEEAGFRLERLETGYMRGPKALSFIYEGAARRGS
jgi:ubiquinone/menaquinone biosynthesis C-methylase UbiE